MQQRMKASPMAKFTVVTGINEDGMAGAAVDGPGNWTKHSISYWHTSQPLPHTAITRGCRWISPTCNAANHERV